MSIYVRISFFFVKLLLDTKKGNIKNNLKNNFYIVSFTKSQV